MNLLSMWPQSASHEVCQPQNVLFCGLHQVGGATVCHRDRGGISSNPQCGGSLLHSTAATKRPAQVALRTGPVTVEGGGSRCPLKVRQRELTLSPTVGKCPATTLCYVGDHLKCRSRCSPTSHEGHDDTESATGDPTAP